MNLAQEPSTTEPEVTRVVQASALGPMPGTNPVESQRVIRGEVGAPNVPYLHQLPERGVGSDLIGRGAMLLEELSVDLRPHGWRIASAPGIDARRAASALRTDLNVLGDLIGAEADGGAELKIQFPGPATLAANLYLHQGERVLSDHGARRDLAQSLALGAVRHLQQVQNSTGRTHLTVYVDEPAAADVLAGTLPTASGYRTLRSIPSAEVRGWWNELIDALKAAGAYQVIVGSTGDAGAWPNIASTAFEAGADGVGANASELTVPAWELLAGAVEDGKRLWLGCINPAGNIPAVVPAVSAIRRPWKQLGLSEAQLDALVLTPATGLDMVSDHHAKSILGTLASYAEALNQVRVDA